MSDRDVQILRSAYEAFARQDMPAVMAALDEDIEWRVPDVLPFGGVFRGHQGVGGCSGSLGTYWQALAVEPDEFIDGGETVAALVDLSGTGAGGELDSRTVHVWRMRGGRAVSFREYPDTARVLQALGLSAAAG